MTEFDTITKTSSKRLLDVLAAFCAGLTRGDQVYIKSIRSYMVWDPDFPSATATDNITTCRPTAWTGNGAFVRDASFCDPTWIRQNFFIDEQTGDDENAGTSAAPLKTDVELYRRWGHARLTIPVTVTYLTSPAGETNYDVEVLSGGSLTVTGTQTTTKSGLVLSAVSTQSRTAGAEVPWAITEATLGAADVGNIVIITESVNPTSVGAYARILNDNGGGSVRVSPFGTFAVSDGAPFTQVTPVVGDTVKVVTMTQLNLGSFRARSSTRAGTLGSPARNCIVFDSVVLDGLSSTFNGSVHAESIAVFYARSILQNLNLSGWSGSLSFHRVCGGGMNGINVRDTTVQLRQTGVTGSIIVAAGGNYSGLSDVYFQNALLSVLPGGVATSQGAAFFDRATSDQTILVQEGAFYRQVNAIPDWGTANAGHGVRVVSGGRYTYAAKPTINSGLGIGREALVGGVDKLYSEVSPSYMNPDNGATLALSA